MYIKGGDLRRMRLQAHITTSEMAEIAGVSTRKTYENWEKNVSTPNINQFMAMCDGCGVSSQEFVKQAVAREDIRRPLDISLGT